MCTVTDEALTRDVAPWQVFPGIRMVCVHWPLPCLVEGYQCSEEATTMVQDLEGQTQEQLD